MSWTPLPSTRLHQTHQSPIRWKGAGQKLGDSGDTRSSEAFLMAREAGIVLTRWGTVSTGHFWVPWEQNQPQISLPL